MSLQLPEKLSFDEIDKLQEGDILVTKFTDTGWTPKFAILSGIVTEYGGILCHAAIVAREYGIPAIVSCKNIMKEIKDGEFCIKHIESDKDFVEMVKSEDELMKYLVEGSKTKLFPYHLSTLILYHIKAAKKSTNCKILRTKC